MFVEHKDMTALSAAHRLRAHFAYDFRAREINWSAWNLVRLLRLTGERPQRVAEMRAILDGLGLAGASQRSIMKYGAFDHGTLWGRDGKPWALVGAPYDVDSTMRGWFAVLTRYSGLKVSVDDRPGLHGLGTHHVRVELVEARRPFKLIPSTDKTRQAARAARRAFAEAFAGDD
jgi:hypothetical protein